MGFFDFFTGSKDPAAIQTQITDLDTKCASDKAALQAKLAAAQGASSTAPMPGTAPIGGRRKRKGGKHTRKHRRGSRRVRTGRRSTRL
jgi:hypothetical protein